MEPIRRYTGYTTPMYQEADAEKGASTPLVVHNAVMHLDEASRTPHPKRSRARKVLLHLIHFSIFLAIFYFLVPRWYPGGKPQPSPEGDMVEYENGSPGPRDCVNRAEWTLHDAQGPPYIPHFRRHASTSLSLPRSSSLLYFLSRGSLSHGRIEIDNDGEEADKVSVEVGIWYNADDVLDRVDVCTLQRAEGKNGVGIFSPQYHRHPSDEYRTHFEVKVRLPTSAKLEHYDEFETDMPIFAHSVGDLEGNVFFRSISLRTTNDPIDVKSLTVNHGSLATTNSHIQAVFNATDVLKVHTSNGHISGNFKSLGDVNLATTNGRIKAKLSLTNNGSSDASKLVLATSNGPIEADITLLSSAEGGTGGAFDVKASTTNSHIDVTYPSAPVDSRLAFIGHSSNAPVRAKLHPTYEGSFSLRTSSFEKPTVQHDSHAPDPAGRGRTRTVNVHRMGRGITEGDVKWTGNENRAELGTVQLSTTNAAVRLTL
ncbi:unnamed protein product [Somion occarium]|uniref:Adhesin domain-containing protein n=1 Tax=Somion occarium TaxID=3059160 RepID=A0ABP1DWX3_9APHY